MNKMYQDSGRRKKVISKFSLFIHKCWKSQMTYKDAKMLNHIKTMHFILSSYFINVPIGIYWMLLSPQKCAFYLLFFVFVWVFPLRERLHENAIVDNRLPNVVLHRYELYCVYFISSYYWFPFCTIPWQGADLKMSKNIDGASINH